MNDIPLPNGGTHGNKGSSELKVDRSTLRQAEELERRKVGRSEGRAKVPEKDAESSEDKARKGRLRKREFEIKDKADKDAKPAPVTTLEPLKDNKTPQNGAKRGPGRPRKYPVVEEAPVKSEPPRVHPCGVCVSANLLARVRAGVRACRLLLCAALTPRLPLRAGAH